MYTISKGPSKIVQKTRRGLNQKLESLEIISNNNNINITNNNDSINNNLNHVDYKTQSSEDMKSSRGSFNNNSLVSPRGINNEPKDIRKSSLQYPVFSNSSSSTKKERYCQRLSQEKPNPKQEEIVKYVNEKWQMVQKELDRSKSTSGHKKVLLFQETDLIPALRDFEPFDLESWWGRKLYKNLIQGPSPKS